MAEKSGEWLKGAGPESDIVVSSRIRLARNLNDYPFISKATELDRAEIEKTLRQSVVAVGEHAKLAYLDVNQLDGIDRQFLVERQLISREHAESDGARGVAIDSGESVSLMVNEEDHVRMHALGTGLTPRNCFDRIKKLDEAMQASTEWAFHPRWGFQSACPTNVGTAVRFSAMLHLPGLRLTGELDKVRQAAKDLHLAVRGYYGEGSESSGNFYQVSNQITLGCSEDELLDRFRETIVPGIIEYERAARRMLLKQSATQLEDRVHRDLAVLQSARRVKVDEAMRRLSMIRLGCCTGLLDGPPLDLVNGLFQQVQTGHLQQLTNRTLTPEEAQIARADLLRARLSNA